MPLGINVSTLYQAFSRIPGQRTNLFRAVDPDGGPSLPSSGSLTLRMEPFGATAGDSRHIVNLRASRQFGLGGGRRFTAEIEAFNAFNSNVAWGEGTPGTGTGTDYRSGPIYGYVVRIVQPRALRFGVVFEF